MSEVCTGASSRFKSERLWEEELQDVLVVSDAGDLESRRFRGEKRGQDVLMYFGSKGKSDERERASSAGQGGSLFSARTQWDWGGVQR